MKNPCDKCKTRWLCKSYGGLCWRKKRYIRKISKRIADAKASELNDYVDKMFARLNRRAEADYEICDD